MKQQDPVVDKIVGHVERVAEHGVPDTARAAAKNFIADTLAVGVAGRRTPWRGEILDMLSAMAGVPEATVFGGGERLPLMHAAMLNAYQVHGQEFDCVHEAAVVHPMAAILPTLLGWAEREGEVSGARLIRAVVVAVDVAVTLGLCSRAPMRFFRPANAGGFGASVGLAMLAGLDSEQLSDALGIYYGQCAGTMQAHTEGSPQLAMQMGFAARSAVTAVELARRGMPGPRAPISGEFGYFALFDGKADPAPFDELGERWRVAELSHKPFPSGRATHGGIDGLQRLMDEDGVTGDRVVACRFYVPPLTARLVARPAVRGMSAGYARLSLPYVGAVCLHRGTVGIGDFTTAALADLDILQLSHRLTVIEDSNPDPNALLPQRVELDLAEGRSVAVTVDAVLGSPVRPLSPEAAQAKFNDCCRSVPGLPPEHGMTMWDAVGALEALGDVRPLAKLSAPRGT
ncbi:MAG: MmgE/PrpD family protein [Alphaproteobacteria bacterium]|nr:MmgE/PrpD family protein [Alphaproteobacteria bacterium]